MGVKKTNAHKKNCDPMVPAQRYVSVAQPSTRHDFTLHIWTWAACMWLVLKPLTAPRGCNQLLFSLLLGWVPCFRLCHFRMLRKRLQSDGNHTRVPTFLCNKPPNKMPERLHCFLGFFLRTHWKTIFKVPPGTAAQWHVPPVIAFKTFRQKLRANSMTIKLYLYIILYMFCLSGL